MQDKNSGLLNMALKVGEMSSQVTNIQQNIETIVNSQQTIVDLLKKNPEFENRLQFENQLAKVEEKNSHKITLTSVIPILTVEELRKKEMLPGQRRKKPLSNQKGGFSRFLNQQAFNQWVKKAVYIQYEDQVIKVGREHADQIINQLEIEKVE